MPFAVISDELLIFGLHGQQVALLVSYEVRSYVTLAVSVEAYWVLVFVEFLE